MAGGAKPQIVVTADLETLSGHESARRPGAARRSAPVGRSGPTQHAQARMRRRDRAAAHRLEQRAARHRPSDSLCAACAATSPCLPRRRLSLPLCDRPPEWTDAHHILSWLAGGPTALWNLVLLCRAHHVLVHEQGWHIALYTSTGLVSVGYPDGQPFALTSSPRGPQPVRGTPPGTTQRRGYEMS